MRERELGIDVVDGATRTERRCGMSETTTAERRAGLDTEAEMTETADAAGTDSGTRGFRKAREGVVKSDKMDKTVVVVVEDRVKHSLYGKVIRRTRNLTAHDEDNSCGVGDRVLLMEPDRCPRRSVGGSPRSREGEVGLASKHVRGSRR
jgi:small subunit ribosomal protein S17